MILQVFGCGFSERPLRSHSVDRCSADLLEPAREIPLCLVIVARSSALANASILADSLIDLPLEAAVRTGLFVEPWHFSSRHSRPSSRVGRPLRRQYSSVHASNSSRSKAMARLPSGMARTKGRTRRLKLFLFIPRYAAARRGPVEGEVRASRALNAQKLVCSRCSLERHPVRTGRRDAASSSAAKGLLNRVSRPYPKRVGALTLSTPLCGSVIQIKRPGRAAISASCSGYDRCRGRNHRRVSATEFREMPPYEPHCTRTHHSVSPSLHGQGPGQVYFRHRPGSENGIGRGRILWCFTT